MKTRRDHTQWAVASLLLPTPPPFCRSAPAHLPIQACILRVKTLYIKYLYTPLVFRSFTPIDGVRMSRWHGCFRWIHSKILGTVFGLLKVCVNQIYSYIVSISIIFDIDGLRMVRLDDLTF